MVTSDAPSSSIWRCNSIFKVGNKVSAYYPSLKATFAGVVVDKDPVSGEIDVEFDPTEDEPDGSSATFKLPYSFLKRRP